MKTLTVLYLLGLLLALTQVQCGAGNECMGGSCPFPQGVCCKSGFACCPHGTICDEVHYQCIPQAQGGKVPMAFVTNLYHLSQS